MSNLDRIIEGCVRGDAAMQSELYNIYSPLFYPVCRRYSMNDAMAQDILVEGFLTIFQNIDSYRGDGSFEGWMRRIFLRTALKQFSKEKHFHDMVSVDDDIADYSVAEYGDVDVSIDVREALLHCLRRLSSYEQLIFNMIAVEEYEMSHVAKLLKLNESTVKSQYYKAKRRMRYMMRKRIGKDYLKKK
ncbi:MAG: sigma-70 family RNA polymerase sigma factor [Bacteroidales bacterium]|nr:sigma-70 family RNA polymerase sigma factor [Bacteroidales bacterium]